MIIELPIIITLGAIIGFISSIPIGPINLALIIRALHHQSRSAFFIAIGSALMEFIYCASAIFGLSSLLFLPQIDKILQASAIIIFIFYGIKAILFKVKPINVDETENLQNNSSLKFIFMGMVLYFSNPGFIAYWVTVAGLISGLRIFEYTLFNNLIFAVSVVVGSFLWSFLLIALVEKYKLKINEQVIKIISTTFGIIILLVCIYLSFMFFKELI
ncbi:MAG: LysE family transporter [Bacteroidetes bacterium]|nr:LysE family transporter [Bacteroidota bacterium]